MFFGNNVVLMLKEAKHKIKGEIKVAKCHLIAKGSKSKS